ncbi:FAD-binding oxidoreductase [Belliella sp. DSM 111904]|uniref:FAD-binding oxidoreductase n=1 Tax=Belliella filtrata TaxID=2923435 RepID=A0ABS9UZT0_9BACT|nr:FAD-binding oxidoreductase [Belliella filtrata]MCH7409677.1 FAD-binding oxidoreductase [Belliella filtrata]
MFKIFLNNKVFECEKDETIVNAALKNGIFLNHSCLTGRCSSCKFKVIEGETEICENELALSSLERDNNYILTCVRKPVSDIWLDAEDLSAYGLVKSRTFPVKIDSFQNLSESIVMVTLRLPPNQKFNFLEGQYIDVIRGGIKRSYSIANASNAGKIELLIKNYEGGQMSNYWFNEMKINDLLRIEGPKGTFFLRDHEKGQNLVFLATGTGIAPIKSILESEKFREKADDFENIYVFWGMRFSSEIFWSPTNKKIFFIPVLSREGKIKKYVQDILLDQQIALENSMFYACGSEEMINQTRNKLILNGLNENSFFSDSFVQSN